MFFVCYLSRALKVLFLHVYLNPRPVLRFLLQILSQLSFYHFDVEGWLKVSCISKEIMNSCAL